MNEKLLHHLWSTATVTASNHIRYKISGQIFRFKSNDVVDALYLPRDTGLMSYGRDVLKHQFEAIVFQGEFKMMIKKSNLPPKWRVIVEVFLHCFSSKTSGWNELSNVLQQVYFTLINWFNYGYAGYVFDALKKQITYNAFHPTEASSLYPRFLTLIIQHQIGHNYPKTKPSRFFEGDC